MDVPDYTIVQGFSILYYLIMRVVGGLLTIQISRLHPKNCDLVRAKTLQNALVPKNATRITGIVHLTLQLILTENTF